MGGLIWKNKKVIIFSLKNKKTFIARCVPFWYEGIGLMFKSKKRARPLLFAYRFSTKMSIFSSCIPFDFLAIWLDKKDNLLEFRIVKPGENGVFPNDKFRKLIEIPVTENYGSLVNFILSAKKDNLKFKLD